MDSKQRDSHEGLRALGAFQAALAIGSALLTLYAVHGSLPFNAMSLPLSSRVPWHVVLPEGWKFFTRNPQSADALPWTRDEGGAWHPGSNGSYQGSAFGLNREVRAQGIEFGLLSSQLVDSAYAPCGGRPAECLDKAAVAKTIANISPKKTLCGRVGVVQQAPVPWAWTRRGREVEMPSKVAVVEVTC